MIKYISSTKIRSNRLEASFGIPGVSTEPKNDFRGQAVRLEQDWFYVGILPLVK